MVNSIEPDEDFDSGKRHRLFFAAKTIKMSKTRQNRRLNIEDIPAERIKELMLQHNLENPTEMALNIAKSAFTFAQLLDDHDQIVGRDIVEAFYTLERMFDLNMELINEMNATKQNI